MEEKKEGRNKKQIVIGITILLLVTLILLGLTYAYYKTNVIGNKEDKSINVVSKDLEVTYADGEDSFVSNATIGPGFTDTKTFKVQNTGDGKATFSILLDEKENTFIRTEDWEYKLTKDGEDSPIATGEINGRKTQLLKALIEIEGKATYNYTLTIEYKDLDDVDQSEDMGKTLSFRVNIGAALGENLINAPDGTLLHAIGADPKNEIKEPLTVPGKAPSGVIYGDKEVIGEIQTVSLSGSGIVVFGDDYTYDRASGTFSLVDVQKNFIDNYYEYSSIYDSLIGKYVPYTFWNTYLEPNGWIDTNGLPKIYYIASATSSSITYKEISATILDNVEEALLSYTEDDYGTSYYYRGNVQNNYVTFNNMCWRIVRIQGDDRIKIVLADKSHDCKNIDNSSDSPFIKSRSMFGTDYIYMESYIKDDIDEFATTQGFSENNNIEQNAEWCSDLSKQNPPLDIKGMWHELLGGYARLGFLNTAQPSLKCDFMGISNSQAQKLNLTASLLSADEVAFAGGVISHTMRSNSTCYLSTSESWWTLTGTGMWDDMYSPSVVHNGGADYSVLTFSQNGLMRLQAFDYASYRPALLLKSTTQISGGTGTQTDPYVVS